MWKELKFNGPWEYMRFVQMMESLVGSGEAEEIEVDPHYCWLPPERWFKNLTSGEIWTLYPGDGPVGPGFHRVDFTKRKRYLPE
jgi:hypothetical protein